MQGATVGPPKKDFRPTAFHRFSQLPVASDVVFRWLGFPQSALFMAQGNKLSIRGKTARAYRYPLRKRVDPAAPLAAAPPGPSARTGSK